VAASGAEGWRIRRLELARGGALPVRSL
jgi:hypothetical protein